MDPKGKCLQTRKKEAENGTRRLSSLWKDQQLMVMLLVMSVMLLLFVLLLDLLKDLLSDLGHDGTSNDNLRVKVDEVNRWMSASVGQEESSNIDLGGRPPCTTHLSTSNVVSR